MQSWIVEVLEPRFLEWLITEKKKNKQVEATNLGTDGGLKLLEMATESPWCSASPQHGMSVSGDWQGSKAALQHGLLPNEFTTQRTHTKSFLSVLLFSMLERIFLSNRQPKNE